MNMLQADQLVISGGTFTQNILSIDHTKILLEDLRNQAAPAAFYDSAERGDPPNCHPETRIAVQRDIIEQVGAALKSCIIWLYGAAGAGKTAIAQTIAETCDASDKRDALLLGSFFFSRTSSSRSNSRRLGASLAYQLTRAIQSTLPCIAEYMKADPVIFDSNLESQLIKLFIKPLHYASQVDPGLCSQPRLVILDGLDECESASVQKHIISVLKKVLAQCPIPLVFLIASRPEVHIHASFDSFGADDIPLCRIALNDEYDADSDIRVYVRAAFRTIKRKPRFRQFIPIEWPTHEDIEKIVDKSSGQFIFAATVVRYVDSDMHNPTKRLRNALESSERYETTAKHSPFRPLDALYVQILTGVEEPVPTLAILHIAGHDGPALVGNFCAHDPNPGNNLILIEQHLHLHPGDVEEHLSALTSLVKVDRRANRLEFFHKSLNDFLFTKERSLDYFANLPSVNMALLKAYLLHVSDRSYFVPFLDALLMVRKHLSLVDPDDSDPELPGLIERFRYSITSTLEEQYARQPHLARLDAAGLSHYIDILYEICEIHNHLPLSDDGFWETCVEAVQNIFAELLSEYPCHRESLELLAAAICSGIEPFEFPKWPLAKSLQIGHSTWKACADIFDHVPTTYLQYCREPLAVTCLLRNHQAREIVRRYLGNNDLYGKHHISGDTLARTAYRCVVALEGLTAPYTVSYNSPNMPGFPGPNYVGAEFHRNEQETWIAGVLERILGVAPWNLELFEALHRFCLAGHRVVGAASVYLEVHATQMVEERVRRASIPPTLVQVEQLPGIERRSQQDKAHKMTINSGMLHPAASQLMGQRERTSLRN